MPDFFISLSSKDRDWGDWIARALQEAGYDVAYAYWRGLLQPGVNLYALTEEWGRNASRVVVLASHNYFASDQTRRELDQATSRDPSGRKGIIVPIKIDDYDLSGTQLGILKQIDLTRIEDEAEMRKLLLEELGEQKPTANAPAFPAGPRSKSKPQFPAPTRVAKPETRYTTEPRPPGLRVASRFGYYLGASILIQALLFLPVFRPAAKALDDSIFQLPVAFEGLVGQPGDVAYTFIDIDDDTYNRWRRVEPLPPKKLLALLKYAATSGARLIVLDVELSSQDELDHYLRDYQSAATPIVLVRSLEPAQSDPQSDACRPLDSAAPRSANVALATQTLWLKRGRFDGLPLWEAVCQGGLPKVLPSVPLFATAWLKGGQSGIARLAEWLETQKPPNSPRAQDFVLNGLHIAAGRGPDARVRFLSSTLRLKWESAWRVEGDDVSPDFVKGRVTVIGGSFEGRDKRSTPVGDMPGAMVLINGIESLYRFGPMYPPPLTVSTLLIALWDLTATLLLVASTQERYAWAAVAAVGLVLLILLCGVTGFSAWTVLAAPAAALLAFKGAKKLRNIKRARSLAIWFLACAALVAQTGTSDAPARIEDYFGHVTLKRGGKPVKLQRLGDLLDGDVLEMGGDDARIAIQLGNQRLQICHPDNRDSACEIRQPTYRVQGAPRRTVASAFQRWVSDYLSEGRTSVNASVRAGDDELALQIPLLKRPETRIAPGRKQFRLSWFGGRAPFSVHLWNVRNESVSFNWTVAEPRLAADVELPVGNYAIDVADKSDSVRGRFRVSDEPIPQNPRPPAGMDDELAGIYGAAWLASQGDGEWLLEAYQQASERVSSYPPGQILLELLASGRRPGAPPPSSR